MTTQVRGHIRMRIIYVCRYVYITTYYAYAYTKRNNYNNDNLCMYCTFAPSAETGFRKKCENSTVR